jgi:hypothetical protein
LLFVDFARRFAGVEPSVAVDFVVVDVVVAAAAPARKASQAGFVPSELSVRYAHLHYDGPPDFGPQVAQPARPRRYHFQMTSGRPSCFRSATQPELGESRPDIVQQGRCTAPPPDQLERMSVAVVGYPASVLLWKNA